MCFWAFLQSGISFYQEICMAKRYLGKTENPSYVIDKELKFLLDKKNWGQQMSV